MARLAAPVSGYLNAVADTSGRAMMVTAEERKTAMFQGSIEREGSIVCGPVTFTGEFPSRERTFGFDWRGYVFVPPETDTSLRFGDTCQILLSDQRRIAMVVTDREGRLVQFRARGRMPRR